MKKVQIITFHNELNYGAVLQAYALQKAIRNGGATPIFMDVELSEFAPKVQHSATERINYFLAYIINRPKNRSFRRFRKNEFLITKDGKGDCDLIVCGSDQIWNPEITYGLQPYYFGCGLLCKKKISYAASCGSVGTIYNCSEELSNLLSDFSTISVREEQTCSYLRNLGIDCKTVVDPTLLIDKKEWVDLASKAKINKLPEKYIFVYDLEGTSQFANIVNAVSREKGIPVVTLRNRPHYQNEIMRFPKASPYEFLKIIHNAEYVVSNSFHAMVFSYLYQKKAYIVPHTRYSERMTSFLNNIDIKLYGDEAVCVDFSEVNTTRIDGCIDDSLSFLTESLGNI